MIASMFDSIAPRLIMASIQRLRDEAEQSRIAAYDKREAFRIGATKKYLWRKAAEGDLAWDERQTRFTHFGYTGRVVDAIAAGIYGGAVKREIVGASEQTQGELDAVYRRSHWDSGQSVVGLAQITCGDAFGHVSYSDDLKRCVLHPVDPGNVIVEPHPDDPMLELTLIERRGDRSDPQGKRKLYWIWQAERVMLCDQDGVPRGLPWPELGDGWHVNPYGVIPYAHWRGLPLVGEYWGMSPIGGVVEINELVNNRASQADHLILYQSHGQAVIKSNKAETKLKTGESNLWLLDPDDDAAFISPNASIAELEQSLEKLVERLFEIGGIPISIIRGGTASSGIQLYIEYRTMDQLVAALTLQARAAEEDFARKICAVGAASGIALPDDPEISVTFDASVIPVDKEAEFQRDLLMLSNMPPLLLPEDFLKKWGTEEAKKDPAAYFARLMQSQPSRVLTPAMNPPAGSMVL